MPGHVIGMAWGWWAGTTNDSVLPDWRLNLFVGAVDPLPALVDLSLPWLLARRVDRARKACLSGWFKKPPAATRGAPAC